MSTDLVFGTPSNSPAISLPEYFSINPAALSDRERNSYSDIVKSLFTHKIDKETTIAIVKSFEERYGGATDDLLTRLSKFKTFLSMFDSTTDLVQSVKNLGMLSKSDLEEYAKETGNWLPSIKQNAEYHGNSTPSIIAKKEEPLPL